ncbi:MAG: peptidylprolyl isomerase [Amaricoccus sp.]
MRKLITAVGVSWLLAAGSPALAANVFEPALTVNTGVITHYDIEQRMKLLSALGATGDLQKLAIQQLTEDRIKVQAARELKIELPEGALDSGLDEFASSRGLKVEDVLRVLDSREIDRQAMDDFVESGLLWREVVTARFRGRAMPSEADLDAAMQLQATMPVEMLTMAEIALPFAERGEAETTDLADKIYRAVLAGNDFGALARQYSRSASAANGGRLDPVPAARVPPTFRSQVLLLSPGQITKPVPIAGGVAIIKLLGISQQKPQPIKPEDMAAARDAMRQQLFTQRISSLGEGYLQELLGDALITQR